MADLKNHPGMWLRDDAAAAINALEDKYGKIVINSAGRTVAEQQDLIDRYDRGEPGIYIPYRPAEQSPHVRDGGIAVDIYNYTDDRAKMNEFGFQWTYGMADPPHYDFVGWTPPAPAPKPETKKKNKTEDPVAVTYMAQNEKTQKTRRIFVMGGKVWDTTGTSSTGPVVWLSDLVLSALINDIRASQSFGGAPTLIYDTDAKHWLYAAHGGVVLLRGNEELKNIREQLSPPELKVPGWLANVMINDIRRGSDV